MKKRKTHITGADGYSWTPAQLKLMDKTIWPEEAYDDWDDDKMVAWVKTAFMRNDGYSEARTEDDAVWTVEMIRGCDELERTVPYN